MYFSLGRSLRAGPDVAAQGLTLLRRALRCCAGPYVAARGDAPPSEDVTALLMHRVTTPVDFNNDKKCAGKPGDLG